VLMYSLIHSLLAGVFGGRRACPPTVRAATVISKGHDKPGLGSDEPGLESCLASIWWPGARRTTLRNRGFAPEPDIPEPGDRHGTNQGDDNKNIHSNTFYLRSII
jgi:hypothetical protein